MLKQEIFTVFDSKAESFSQPFFAVNAAVAMRLFSAGVNDPETPIGRHPEDYSLFRVGVWNSENGALAGTESPIHVCNALQMVKKEG